MTMSGERPSSIESVSGFVAHRIRSSINPDTGKTILSEPRIHQRGFIHFPRRHLVLGREKQIPVRVTTQMNEFLLMLENDPDGMVSYEQLAHYLEGFTGKKPKGKIKTLASRTNEALRQAEVKHAEEILYLGGVNYMGYMIVQPDNYSVHLSLRQQLDEAREKDIQERLIDEEDKPKKYKDVYFDPITDMLFKSGVNLGIKVTNLEHKILSYLLLNPGDVVTDDEFRVFIGEWASFEPDKLDSVLQYHMINIRKKLKNLGTSTTVHHFKDSGYAIIDPSEIEDFEY